MSSPRLTSVAIKELRELQVEPEAATREQSLLDLEESGDDEITAVGTPDDPSTDQSPRLSPGLSPPQQENLTQRTVNAPRTVEDNKKFWGGKMVDSIQAVDGNISLFSDECLSVHGLYAAFYSRNGWGRTALYLVTWLGFAALFLTLTIPLVKDYQARALSTYVGFDTGTSEGLPLPIVTVCPHGDGIRCDCLLWRKLYCRYDIDVPNEEWRRRFGEYGCVRYFQRTDLGEPFWFDPQCEDFINGSAALTDACAPTQREIKDLSFLQDVNADVVYDAIVAREESDGGPYITYEELAIYGSLRIADNVHFFRAEGMLRNRDLVDVNAEWVERSYLEPSRFQMCSHFRAPFDEKQTVAGAMNGITIFVTHMAEDMYPFNNANSATPAVDIAIIVMEPERYNDTTLFLERHTYFPVAAGAVTRIEYAISGLERQKGWGPSESRLCSDGATPRSSCVEKTLSRRVATLCNCSDLQYLDEYAIERSLVTCSANPGTVQGDCVLESEIWTESQVSLEKCPTRCRSFRGAVKSNIQLKLSGSQVEYMKHTIAFGNPAQFGTRRAQDSVGVVDQSILQNESAIIHIGVDSLFTVTYQENPKVALAALLGQLGGNAGLWCGLSFVMMLEALEFLIVALLYGTGFYSGRRNRKPLGHRVVGIFRRCKPRRENA